MWSSVCYHMLFASMLWTCVAFSFHIYLLPVVVSPLLFRQLCLLSSSPVFGSASCCPVTQSPCPFISFPSRVCSFGLTPPSQDIVLSLTVVICHPSRSIPIIKSSGVWTPVPLSWTSILSSQTFIPLSWTYFPLDVSQYLTVSKD